MAALTYCCGCRTLPCLNSGVPRHGGTGKGCTSYCAEYGNALAKRYVPSPDAGAPDAAAPAAASDAPGAMPGKATTLYVGKIATSVEEETMRALLEACG